MTRNVAASVRQRLRDLARARREDFQFVLIRYGLERLLYRLSQSFARDTFVLKGAALFALWTESPHRATRDIDLAGRGDNSVEQAEALFRRICTVDVQDDGLVLLADTVRAQAISADEEYQGLRVTLTSLLERARIALQVDIGFGDVITPEPTQVDYPVLLDFPAPRLLAYPKETVVAEKLQAMVELGIANSRMKDFFDLWVMGHELAFDGQPLSDAIRATFARRRTPLPQRAPLAFTTTFSADAAKQTQWRAFLTRMGRHDPAAAPRLEDLCAFLESFLMPPVSARSRGEVFASSWPPGGPWQKGRD